MHWLTKTKIKKEKMRMTEQYFNLEQLLNNQRNLDNKFKEKMGFDKIDKPCPHTRDFSHELGHA